MKFEIKIKDHALKFIADLQKDEREKIKEIFLILKNDPVPFKVLDVAKMKGFKNTYRIRKGRIRTIYEIFWDEKMIIVHRVGFRGDVYK